MVCTFEFVLFDFVIDKSKKKTQLPKHNIDDKNLIKLFNSDGVECIQKSMKFYNYLYSVCSKIDK